MYVDESGDCGLVGSPTDHFVLCGLVVHEHHWSNVLDGLIGLRRRLRDAYGLHLREELHAADFITRPGALQRIARHRRLAIVGEVANHLGSSQYLRVMVVVVDKRGKPQDYDVFSNAWRTLIQRFQNTIGSGNFPGTRDDERGLLVPDRTDVRKLTGLLRAMRRWNPVPNTPFFGSGYRNLPVTSLVEDPWFRDSQDSYLIQAADTVAYLVHQGIRPNAYMRKKGGGSYYKRLDPVFCRQASRRDARGWVRL